MLRLSARPGARDDPRSTATSSRQAPDEVCGGLALITAPPEDFVPEDAARAAGGGHHLLLRRPARGGRVRLCDRCERRRNRSSTWSSRCRTRRCSRCSTPATRPESASTSRSTGCGELPDEAIDVILEHAEETPGAVRPADPRPDGRSGRANRQQRARADGPRGAVGLLLPDDVDGSGRGRCTTSPGHARLCRGDAARSVSAGRPTRTSSRRDEGLPRSRASYGEDKYARLVALKNEWDPDNLFRLNQNIAPAGA